MSHFQLQVLEEVQELWWMANLKQEQWWKKELLQMCTSDGDCGDRMRDRGRSWCGGNGHDERRNRQCLLMPLLH